VKARINLWLFQGRPVADGEETEVVIESFEFQPLDHSREGSTPDSEKKNQSTSGTSCSHARQSVGEVELR
jgi:hypothetical protein